MGEAEKGISHHHRGHRAHPYAPVGGGGPGVSRTPGVISDISSSQSSPHINSPVGRYRDWQRNPSRANPYSVLLEFLNRIRDAKGPRQLVHVASEFQEFRKTYQSRGLIKKPEEGDAAVKAEVKEALGAKLGERLKGFEKIIFEGGWEGIWTWAEKEETDESLVKGFKAAFWEIFLETVKKACGEGWSKIADLISKGKFKEAVEALKATAEDLAKALADHKGLLQKTLTLMRQKHMISGGKRAEAKIAKLLKDRLEKIAKKMDSLQKVISNPIYIAIKVFLTSTTVPDDKGELYLAFQAVDDALAEKWEQVLPPEPMDETGRLAPDLDATDQPSFRAPLP